MTPIAQGTQIATPRTADELTRLIERRDEWRGQVESLNSRRGELADQVQRLGDQEVRQGPLARLRELDAQIGRVERQIQAADEAVAQAKANGVPGAEVTVFSSPPPFTPPVPETPQFAWSSDQGLPWRDRVLNNLEVTAPITLATVVLLGALLYWRISRSMRNQFTRMLGVQQARLEEIQRSVDSVAVEMERVSENQRYVTKLVGDRPQAERR